MKKRSVTEVLAERMLLPCKPLFDVYNEEKDPSIKLAIKYEIAKELQRQAILEISVLTQNEFRRYVREQVEPLNDAWEKLGAHYLDQKLAEGELSIQDINMLTVEAELLQEFSNRRLTKPEKIAINEPRNVQRFMTLAGLDSARATLQLAAAGLAFEPLSELDNLVARRFGADMNWILAVGVLAISENMIKKKLIELGRDDKEVEDISNDRRQGFKKLLDILENDIKKKEHRSVSIYFYKSSALRVVRNKFEHQGYKQKISIEEFRDLLKETKRFENEIFPKIISDS